MGWATWGIKMNGIIEKMVEKFGKKTFSEEEFEMLRRELLTAQARAEFDRIAASKYNNAFGLPPVKMEGEPVTEFPKFFLTTGSFNKEMEESTMKPTDYPTDGNWPEGDPYGTSSARYSYDDDTRSGGPRKGDQKQSREDARRGSVGNPELLAVREKQGKEEDVVGQYPLM